MPELPDLELYVEALGPRVGGERLLELRFGSPFVLRTVEPPYVAAHGRGVERVRRLGKRIVLDLEGGLHVAMHLMLAGRLQWRDGRASVRPRSVRAALDFADATLLLTEEGSKHRAALHVVDDAGLAALDAGGEEPLEVAPARFVEVMRRENRTLKRALTDPRNLAGVGNAYSDEALHRARLSPVLLTARATDDELLRLHAALQGVLREWTERLRAKAKGKWPARVTAFHPEMAVHGKFGQACPACGTTVQRIVKAETESNYCPRCQTGGKVLADRALSRLLHDDWPSTIEAWEERFGG